MFSLVIYFIVLISALILFIRRQGFFGERIGTSIKGTLILIHGLLLMIIFSILGYGEARELIIKSEGNPYLKIFLAFIIGAILSWYINFGLSKDKPFSWKRVFLGVAFIIGAVILYVVYSVVFM